MIVFFGFYSSKIKALGCFINSNWEIFLKSWRLLILDGVKTMNFGAFGFRFQENFFHELTRINL